MIGVQRHARSDGYQGNVIAMERFRSGAGLSPIHQVEAYWSALQAGGEIPRRAQIDPRGMENVLSHTFVIERIAPALARFRLAGQHMTEVTGLDVRGMPLSAVFTAAARPMLAATLAQLFDTPAVAELTLMGDGRLPREARMILLPLRSDLGDVNRALGALVTEPGTGSLPCRFDVTGTAMRQVFGPSRATEELPEPVTGFAEAPAPFAGRAPHLRVVRND